MWLVWPKRLRQSCQFNADTVALVRHGCGPYTWSMNRSAIAIALLSATLFGASTPLAKLLLGSVDPWMLAGLLYLGAGIGLGVVHLLRQAIGLGRAEAPLARADLGWLALVILFGGVMGPLLLLFGLRTADAAGASLLLNLESVATLGIAWLVFRENVDRRLLLGALAIVVGALALSWHPGASVVSGGSVLIAAACLCWGIDNNLTRKLSSADPLQIAMLKGLVAGGVNLGIALAIGQRLPGPALVLGSGLVGFLGYGLSLALFVTALRHLGAARTGAYFALAPFVGALLAVGLLGDTITWQLGLAAGMMGIGLWLHLSERHDHGHDHMVFDHDHRHSHDAHHQHGHDDQGPHSHPHHHGPLKHAHGHYPDLHHRHGHG